MLNHQTMEKLHAMRLIGMAEAYRQQREDTGMAGLSFEERYLAVGGPASCCSAYRPDWDR